MAQSDKPEKVYRIGFVSASVFARDVEIEGIKRTLRSVNVQKRYLDDDGKAQCISAFGLGELPQAIRCLQLAQEYVEGREADLKLDD